MSYATDGCRATRHPVSTFSVSRAAELQRMHRSTGVDEAQAVSGESLHDEPFPTKQSDTDLALKGDPDRDATGRAEKRILLADQLAAELLEIHREYLAGIRRRERHVLLARAAVRKHRHEEAFTRDQPLAGSEQSAHHARPLLGSVAEDRLHLNGGLHVHHRACFSDRALARIELHLDELHLAAQNLEINFVLLCHVLTVCSLHVRGTLDSVAASVSTPSPRAAEAWPAFQAPE